MNVYDYTLDPVSGSTKGFSMDPIVCLLGFGSGASQVSSTRLGPCRALGFEFREFRV